jgi:hypothetical protein
VVAIVVSSSGGSSTNHNSAAATSVTKVGSTHHAHHASRPTLSAAARAAMTVTVLNATETEGLAHRTAAQLQRSGFSQAVALGGKPTGANQSTVVEYAPGQKKNAEEVARTLSVATVQPLEESVTALADSAQVVVIVGANSGAAG